MVCELKPRPHDEHRVAFFWRNISDKQTRSAFQQWLSVRAYVFVLDFCNCLMNESLLRVNHATDSVLSSLHVVPAEVD